MSADKAKPSLKKLILVNLLVTLALLLVAETVYRIVLNQRNSKPAVPYYFFATSGAMLRYDRELGYAYVPNHHSYTAIIKQGQVVRLYTNQVNSVGMTSREGVYDPAAKRQILVAGDSFTALTYSDQVWADAMHDALEARGEDVSVYNAGRDGYGLLQMIHAAAIVSATNRFNDIVIAFITDDLTRGRFWRYDLADANPPRVVTSTQSDPSLLTPPYIDTYLLDPRVTADWANGLLANPDLQQSDPLLKELISTLQERKRDFQNLPLFGGGYSVLWNQLAHQDPYSSLNRRGRNPRHSLNSFVEDAEFTADVTALRQHGARLSFYYIPDLDELHAGAYRTDPRTEMLLESLEDISGVKAVRLLPGMLTSPEELDSFFLVPHDHHPNARGMKRIGGLIAESLTARPSIHP